MSSKNNPGAFRCYEAALPDEHIFTILARDPAGPATLRFWADERERVGKTVNPDDLDRIADARRDADLMHEWREANLDPMGDGSGPTWKLVRITDDDGGPIRSLPEQTRYVPADRDGDEAVRLNVEWLRARTEDLTRGQITREQFADLISLACQSPQRSREVVVPVEEAAADAAKRDQRAISLMGTVTKAIGQIDAMIEGGSVPSYSQIEDVRRTLFDGLGNQPIRGEYVDGNGVIQTTTLDFPNVTSREQAERIANRTQPSSQRPPVVDLAPDDLAHSPEVPPHRFSTFHKGDRYAYARGLEINPTHLPVCLDEMARDGWHLLAIFGATDSKHVGFVFERHVYTAFELAHGFGDPGPARAPESDQWRQFKAGVPLDEIDAPAAPEPVRQRFVIEYAEDDGAGGCQIVRAPYADWPEWAQPCGAGGMGRGLEP